MEQSTDDADWLVRLAAIELQRVKIEAGQRMLDESARRLDLQKAERLVAIELQKEERLVAQMEKKSAAERELSLAVIEFKWVKLEIRELREKNREQERQRNRELREKNREQEQQCKLDYNTTTRLERRRIRDQEQEVLEATCMEESRRASRASVEQTREIHRLYEESLREKKRLRDEAGIRAGGGYKRPAATQPVIEPHGKKRLVGTGDQCSRTKNPRRLNLDFDGEIPSFLRHEFEYMGKASLAFLEDITVDIQMSCMRDYQGAITHASKRLPCGICGGSFQEDRALYISLQDKDLRHYLQTTHTSPDSCAITHNRLSICLTCNSCIAINTIPPLSAGNFVNRLFCQEYPAALRDLNTVEERFIACAHVIGAFLKLTSSAQKGISYRGARGHYVAVKQDPSNILSILPTKRLQDHTTITVSWEKETPPSEENLARFCSVNKNKVLQALLWLYAHNPVYKSVTIDYELLDSWPQDHIPQEIQDAFLALQTNASAGVQDEREGYATSL